MDDDGDPIATTDAPSEVGAPPVEEPTAPLGDPSGPTVVEIPTDSNGYGSTVVEIVAQDITDIAADDGSQVTFDVDSPSTTLIIVHSFATIDGTVNVTVTT